MQDSRLPGPNLAAEQLTANPGPPCLHLRADEGCLLDLLVLLSPKWLSPHANGSTAWEELWHLLSLLWQPPCRDARSKEHLVLWKTPLLESGVQLPTLESSQGWWGIPKSQALATSELSQPCQGETTPARQGHGIPILRREDQTGSPQGLGWRLEIKLSFLACDLMAWKQKRPSRLRIGFST